MHGLLLLSHGSRDPRAAAVVEELVQALALRSGLPVRACHLDFTDPTPGRGAAADGGRRLHLGAGGAAAVHPRLPRHPRRARGGRGQWCRGAAGRQRGAGAGQ